MTHPQVKDTLAVMAISGGVVTLALLIMSALTGNNWWIVVFMAGPAGDRVRSQGGLK